MLKNTVDKDVQEHIIKNATKLNTNECAWGPAPGVLKALAKTPVDALRLYPSPLADKVRKAASEVFEIDADQVLVGNFDPGLGFAETLALKSGNVFVRRRTGNRCEAKDIALLCKGHRLVELLV